MYEVYKSMKNLRIYYDKEADFLEISSGKATECYAEEVRLGIFLRKDEKTGKPIVKGTII